MEHLSANKIITRDQTSAVHSMVPDLFVIQHIRWETHDTFTMELKPENEKQTFYFLPGQFNMLYVFGAGEIPISISGDAAVNDKLVHTIRVVGSVTKVMRKLKPGDMLGVRGPFGNCWPVKEVLGKDIIIIAGGIGLAPLMPALYHIVSNREKYGAIALLYGARSPEDILFKKELEKWRSRFDLQVFVTVDKASQSWKGNVGLVTRLIKKATFDPDNTVVITCGPEIMMRFAGAELEKYNIAGDHIFLSMERNMECAIGLCGHCQLGPQFICKDGPIFRFDRMYPFLTRREI
jgi:NAD(P)H-flavin reductase